MANYKNEQEMLFAFLSTIDYSKTFEEIEYDMGYDLGDWAFMIIPTSTIKQLVKSTWIELHNITSLGS